MKYLFTILSFILMTSAVYTQKEAYNWYFGGNAGLTFNTPNLEPSAITNGALNSDEGCASISDGLGRLLFYTDGETVWNKNHNPMPNGTGLFGSRSSTQSAIIVPRPGTANIYYVVTTDDTSGQRGCRYSIVDMNQAAGQGNVITKNTLLFNESTEKLTAVRHANGIEWWILAHEWNSDVFRAYLVNSSGISTFAVFSVVGSIHRGNSANKTGYLKASINGTKIALVLPEKSVIELFDFDNSRGKVQNPISLTSQVFNDAYGLEFSKSGTKLYVSKREYPSAILQFDISSWSKSAILNSQTLIYDIKEQGAFQAMQIGPDDKIYVARDNKPFLGRINYPELSGDNCVYIDSAIYLSGQTSKKGLPNIYSKDIVKLKISSNSPVCIGDSLFLNSEYVFGAIYDWSGPMGFWSKDVNPSILITSSLQSGFYKLKMTVSNVEYTDSVFVDIINKPDVQIRIDDKQPFCFGDSIKLTAVTDADNKIEWNTGDTTKSIYVKRSDRYYVTVVNENGCTATVDRSVTFTEIATEIVPLSSTEFCIGDSVELIALPILPGAELSWSTGETGQVIYVKESKKIILTIKDISGCTKKDTIEVKSYEKLEVEVKTDGQFCIGDTVELSTYFSGSDFIFLWSTGQTSPAIKVTDDITGWVYVRLNSGCGDTAFFDYTFNTKPDLFISTDKSPVICDRDEITLTALIRNTNEQVSYFWSTGDTSKSIRVTEEGRYSVTVSTNSGCSNQSYIDVTVLERPEVEITPDGPLLLCEGDFLRLKASPVDSSLSYLWSTGETGTEIVVTELGTYYLFVTNSMNCSDTSSIEITFNPKPNVEIKASGPLRICKGNNVVFSTEEKYSSYLWSTGETTETISIQTAGTYWVDVIDSNGCTGRSEELILTVSEVDIEIENLSGSKFGQVCLGIVKEQEVRLINNGSESIFVDNINLALNQNYTLSIEPTLPAVIPPGREVLAKLRFEPGYLGYVTDTLTMSVSSPCFYEFSLLVEGTGTARTTASIPEVVLPIGVEYCIPVRIKLNCGDTLPESINFQTKITMDLSMFLPDTVLHPFVKQTYISGTERIFEIEGRLDNLGQFEQEIFSICGTVMYGNYEWVPIILDEFDWDKSSITTLSLPGELEIYGICEFDISRIKFTEQTTLKVYSGDVTPEIKLVIGTEEQGIHQLHLSDLRGNIFYSNNFTHNTEQFTEYEFIPEFNAVSSGYYLVILKSPNSISTIPIIIYQ